ncbi:MAG: hypothetical protein ACI936_002289 [Paraglaciecola sp.]|jgi:hypothetical protein
MEITIKLAVNMTLQQLKYLILLSIGINNVFNEAGEIKSWLNNK